jgi:hypothetical protein
MTQAIIYSQDNGQVAVCYPVNELSIQEIKAQDTPVNSIIVDISFLPNNDFFNAWELNGTAVTVNLDKAKTITKERLRAERTPLLLAQDVAFQRALEEGADTTAIVAEKQRLRDITNLADQATTLDELKALEVK